MRKVDWFSRLGRPFDRHEANLATGYLAALPVEHALPSLVKDWVEAEAIIRDPLAGAGWWEQEEAERKLLMEEVGRRIGSPQLLDALTDAAHGHAESTYAGAMRSGCTDEALGKVASGAALTAIHLRALALLAGCREEHMFMQRYALFEAGRFPLGMRQSTFAIF